jgi:hypothetical protein
VSKVRRYRMFIIVLALAVGVGQAQDAELARGSELLSPFKRDLQEALRLGLTKGPVEAIGACRVQAPEIAKALSKDGINLGRSSHRLRNPANSPPEWVSPIWLTSTILRIARHELYHYKIIDLAMSNRF